jgi:hypothetical protein
MIDLLRTCTRNFQIKPIPHTGVLLLLFSLLSGCDGRVNPSFGYAFIGTSVIMVVALYVATVVTKRGDKHGHKNDDNKK